MCDVATRCPACGDDLASQEVECAPGHHIFHCQCSAIITVTQPVPGLVMTRQDAVVKP